ncbi:MAG: hypothetical protein NXI32_02890 [bacterium]|nr:hypothetical protein [bacterium]
MVRLRSDRWYSADGQRRVRRQVASQSSGHRRLLSLCFLLALVLVLMQKAADPGNVSRAFRALGVPLGDEVAIYESAADRRSSDSAEDGNADSLWRGMPAANAQTESLAGSGRSTDGGPSELVWRAVCRDLIPRLLEDATERQASELALKWYTATQPQTVAWLATQSWESEGESLLSLEADSLQKLQLLRARLVREGESLTPLQPGQPPADASEWLRLLERFATEWREMCKLLKSDETSEVASVASDLSHEFRDAMTAFVDGKLFAALADGTPWRRSEMLAFHRWLERASQLADDQATSPSAIPLLSTLQLESEHETFRGRMIRYRGSLRRAERMEPERIGDAESVVSRATQALDDSYWVLWVRGEDQATQPVAIYADASVAGGIASHIEGQHYPEMEVTGIVAKRLAYASESGVQVAPTIFASAIRMRVDQGLGSALVPRADLGRELWVALGLGLLLAGIVLCPVIWRWRNSRAAYPRSGSAKRGSSKRVSQLNRVVLWAICLSGGALTISQPTAAQESDQPAIELPWESQGDDAAEQVRQLLQSRFAHAVSETEWQEVQQYLQGTTTDFPDALLKLVHTWKQIGWRIGDAATQESPTQSMGDDTWNFEIGDLGLLVEPITQAGIITQAGPVALTIEQELWFQRSDADRVFQLQLSPTRPSGEQLEDVGTLAVLCVRCPSQWLTDSPLRQPAVVRGYALRSVDTKRIVCLLAQAPEWRLDGVAEPSQPQSEWLPEIPPQLQILSRAGFDLANLDVIVSRNQQSLRSDEAAALFSMLRIVGAPTSASKELVELEPKLGPVEAMADPPQAIGRPIDWKVRLVSGTLVPMPSVEPQADLSAKHYVQFDGFVDIGDQRVRYQVGDKEIIFDREFPITIVTRNETAFVPQERLRRGELSWAVGKFARLQGCFYRLWSFNSELMQQQSKPARQAAPLIIASELIPDVPTVVPSRTGEIGWFGYALCAATLCILAGILHQALRRDHRRLHSRNR